MSRPYLHQTDEELALSIGAFLEKHGLNRAPEFADRLLDWAYREGEDALETLQEEHRDLNVAYEEATARIHQLEGDLDARDMPAERCTNTPELWYLDAPHLFDSPTKGL